MNIRLTPNSEQILREQLTRGHFRSPEEVIERALQALVSQPGSPVAEQQAVNASLLSPAAQTPEQFAAFLDGLGAYSNEIPPMPRETFSREMIYQSHP